MKTSGGVDGQTHVFFNTAQVEVRGQLHASAASPSRKECGWAPEPIWPICINENSRPCQDSNSDHSVFQLVASRYTDCAVAAQYWR
jgi:hypothetical protein